MAKPPVKPNQPAAADLAAYIVRAGAGAIRHDGVEFREGERIDLTAHQAASLAHLIEPVG